MKDIEYIVQNISKYNNDRFELIKEHEERIVKLILEPKELSILKGYIQPEEYLDVLNHLFLACIMFTKEISTISPPKYQPSTYRFQAKQWLCDITPLPDNGQGKQGNVYTGTFLGEQVILKRPKKSHFLENTLKDYFTGIRCINSLRAECSMFTYTYGTLSMESKPLDEVWVITELIKGKTLKSEIKKLSFKSFLIIFIQLLIALELGQERFKFCHYDLHTNNIILVKSEGPLKYHLFTYDITVNHKYKPVLIDFGMSSIHYENIDIGQKNNETNGIFPFLFPGYDAYIFLLFSREIAKPNVVKGIDDLIFSFYGDIDHGNYVETLKNTCGRYTPLMFLEHIKSVAAYQRLFGSNIKFTDRTVDNKASTLRSISSILNGSRPLVQQQAASATFKVSSLEDIIQDIEQEILSSDDHIIKSLLDDVHTIVTSSWILKDKQWSLKIKSSKLYDLYLKRYPEYTCYKRLASFDAA